MPSVPLPIFSFLIVFLGASLVAQIVKNLPEMLVIWVLSLGQEDPLEEGMEPTPVFLPGEFHGQRSLVSYSPWDHEESDMTEGLTLSLSLLYGGGNF